jgi:hypothetical protein
MRQPERFSEHGGTIKGCDVFAAGHYRGKTYSVRDLDDMVENFRRFSVGDRRTGRKALLDVPGVIGHSEEQEFLERSDIPAAAWCSNLYRVGRKLKADFSGVPPKVMKLLKGKRYKKVSAEVYDEPPEGIPGRGKMLRRVAFLGGDIPQIKGLDDIPLPEEHSESSGPTPWAPTVTRFVKAIRKRSGTWEVFSEVTPMKREDMIEALEELGFDTSTITPEIPNEFLAEILRVFQGEQEEEEEGPQEAEAAAYHDRHARQFAASGITRAAFVRSFRESGRRTFAEFLDK